MTGKTEKKKGDQSGPAASYLFPIRQKVKHHYRKGRIILEYPKNFNRFERFLHRFLGGPTVIKRPLDRVGTLLWEMSDGNHSLEEIYLEEQRRFHERVEPVEKVVGGLLEVMLKLGLMVLDYRPQVKKDGARGGGKTKGKRVK